MTLDSYSLAARAYLAKSHLQAAVRIARDAHRVEDMQSASFDHGVLELAMASVVLSSAFLEGLINELYSDCAAAAHSEGAKILSADERLVLGAQWPSNEFDSTLDKYTRALELMNRPAIDRSAATWANTKLLVTLRNVLVHYKPETIVVASDDSNNPVTWVKLEAQLRNKVAPNPVFAGTTTHFLVEYLSADCASWACRSALAFADEFYSALGGEPPYEFERDRMELRDTT